MSLWKYINSPRTRYKTTTNQETSLYACHKASLTVEAAVVIPLLTGFLISILIFFRILYVQAVVDECILYAGRQTAVEGSVITSKELLLVSAKSFFRLAFEKDEKLEKYIKDGLNGINLNESSVKDSQIILKAKYEVSLPFKFGKIGAIPLYSQNTFYKWTSAMRRGDESEYVYITVHGTVYHTSTTCQVLDLKINTGDLSQMSKVRGKNGQKYYKCTSCGSKIVKKKVYYTDYGTRYHGDRSCKALKRIIKSIRLSEVGDRKKCSFCK